MPLSEGLTKAIARVHEHFFTKPSIGLRPWIDVDDSTAHNTIGLLGGLLWRSIDPLVIRNTPAHSTVLAVALQPPWNELLSFDADRQELSLSGAIDAGDAQELVALLTLYNKSVIETVSPLP